MISARATVKSSQWCFRIGAPFLYDCDGFRRRGELLKKRCPSVYSHNSTPNKFLFFVRHPRSPAQGGLEGCKPSKYLSLSHMQAALLPAYAKRSDLGAA